MRIDLRYVIVFLAFYAPGVMMLIGGFVLGFSIDEMRTTVALFGFIFGIFPAIFTAAVMYDDFGPIWLTLWRKRD